MAVADAQAVATATEPTPRWWPLVRWGFVAALVGVLGLTELPALQGRPVYEVRGGQIIARSVMSSRVIPAGTPVRSEQIALSWWEILNIKALWSPGGYLAGRFSVNRYGPVDIYSDGFTRSLVFLTRPRVTVLTPAKPTDLLATWRAGGTGIFHPVLSPSFTLLPLLALFALSVRRPRVLYRLTPDALEVRTGLHKQRFPFAATKAELTAEPLGSPLLGRATPGYYTGKFSTKSVDGGRVQALATASRPVAALVLTLDGVAYYLTPADPAALATQFGP